MDQNLVGKQIMVNGVALLVKAIVGSEYEIWSVNNCGVWFATDAEMRAALA